MAAGKVSHVQPRQVAVAIAYRLARSSSSSSSTTPQSESEADPNGTQAGAGAGPTRKQQVVEVCLVSSRKHANRWVLPKGGIEKGEDVGEAARRELWEEAGLRSPSSSPPAPLHHAPTLTSTPDHKPHRSSPSTSPTDPRFIPRAIYTAVEVRVGEGYEGEEQWPEKHERERRWVRFEEACQLVKWRGDGMRLLEGSSLA